MSKGKVSIAYVFKTIIWPKRNLVFIGLVLIVFSRLASLVLPWASKPLLDEVIPSKDFNQLVWLLSLVLGALATQAITSFLLTKILSVQAGFDHWRSEAKHLSSPKTVIWDSRAGTSLKKG